MHGAKKNTGKKFLLAMVVRGDYYDVGQHLGTHSTGLLNNGLPSSPMCQQKVQKKGVKKLHVVPMKSTEK